MSSSSTPIPPARFAAALRDLPTGSLHAKAAELRNSLAHLRASNAQLAEYAAAGDDECAEAVRDNEETMRRFEERIGMLRREVEGRGLLWVGEGGVVGGDDEGKDEGDDERDGDGVGVQGREGENGLGRGDAHRSEEGRSGAANGRLSDEELRRRLEARLNEEEEGDGDGGLHL